MALERQSSPMVVHMMARGKQVSEMASALQHINSPEMCISGIGGMITGKDKVS